MEILEFLFPKKCLGCGVKGRYFCPHCSTRIKKVAQICPVCERPSPFGKTHPSCCSHYSLDGLTSFFAYEGIIKEAIHKLKYRLAFNLKDELSEKVLEELKKRKEEFVLLDRFLMQEKPTVIPIPLYWYKENYRGFNQAELIGKIFSKGYNLLISDKLITRRKMTFTQAKLNPKERQKNVQDAFVISPNPKLLIANYLLVDDVWTTGATLKTAGNILKRAGAKKVWGLTLAR